MGDPQPKRTLYDRFCRTYPQEFPLEQQTISMTEDYISRGEVTYMQQGYDQQGGYGGYNNNNRSYPQQLPLEKTPIEKMMESFISKLELKFEALEHNVTTIGNTVIGMSTHIKTLEEQVGQLVKAQSEQQQRAQPPNKGETNSKVYQCNAIEVQIEEFEEFEALEVEDLGDESDLESELEETRRRSPKSGSLDTSLDREAYREVNTGVQNTPLDTPIDREGDRDLFDEELQDDPLDTSLDREVSREAAQKSQNVPLDTPIDREGGREVPLSIETCDFFSDDFSLRYLFDPTPDEESIQLSGVVEDVRVRVRGFDFPADFMIMEMEEDIKQPLILGRSFLATSGACFDMECGDLIVRVHKKELEISVLGAKRRKLKDGGEKNFHFYPP